MPLTSIVVIVLRIMCFSWFVRGLSYLVIVVGNRSRNIGAETSFNYYAGSVAILILAAVTLILAKPIARLLTPRPDATVNVGQLNHYDLYCFAFVFLGLSFLLTSFGNALNGMSSYITVLRTTYEGNPQRDSSFHKMTEPLITLVAGACSLLFASRCAKKLIKIERKQDASAPTTAQVNEQTNGNG